MCGFILAGLNATFGRIVIALPRGSSASMEPTTHAGRPSRKCGMFAEPDRNVTILRCPEYCAAFEACDPGQTGLIDLKQLGDALRAVQASTEAGGSCENVSMRPFHSTTCCLLCSRFGDGTKLNATQFCELLYYLQTLKLIFMQLDAHRSGGIEGGELQRGFQLSGASMDSNVVEHILQTYDADESKALEFDEFVHMRLEWDHFIHAWDHCTNGGHTIEPGQLLRVLEEIKRTTEPVNSILTEQGLPPPFAFHLHRPFQTSTCERLILRFGYGSCFLSFEQFCTMMVWLRDIKEVFVNLDARGCGWLSIAELTTAMARLGMSMPPQLVAQICQPFDINNSGEIEFDEFVQMMVEWNDVWREQWRFSDGGRIGPAQLQELFGHVRVIYRVVDGVAQLLRPVNFNTCRWLVAKFGSCQAGEAFARTLTWVEFLYLVWYVKESHAKFLRFNLTNTGALSTEELGAAMASCGIKLEPEAIENIRRSYDVDGSGTFEFDEFLQLILECQLYEHCFEVRASRLSSSAAMSAAPTNGRGLTLDKSAFLSLVFSVPRHVGRERLVS